MLLSDYTDNWSPYFVLISNLLIWLKKVRGWRDFYQGLNIRGSIYYRSSLAQPVKTDPCVLAAPDGSLRQVSLQILQTEKPKTCHSTLERSPLINIWNMTILNYIHLLWSGWNSFSLDNADWPVKRYEPWNYIMTFNQTLQNTTVVCSHTVLSWQIFFYLLCYPFVHAITLFCLNSEIII